MEDHGGFNQFLTPPGSHPSSSAGLWELHKPTIKVLYVMRWRTLEQVMEVMKRDHNFIASKKVYRKRLAKWGFERRIKGWEREAILRKWIERGAVGKQSEFTLRGRKVEVWHVTDYCRRTREDLQRMASQESSGAATPPHLRCSTPEPGTRDGEWSTDFLQKYAKEIEAYKERSMGI